MYDFLLIASCVVFAGVCAIYARHEAASLFHPATIYLAFHGFVFVIRPLFARLYDFELVYRVYDFQPSVDDKITVILGANLAMLVFTFLVLRIADRAPLPLPEGAFAQLRQRLMAPVLAVAAVLGPLAAAAQLSIWTRRADPYATMERDPATGIFVNIDGVGWFADAAMILGPIAVLAVWLARFRWPGWLVFLAASVLMLGSGGRGTFIFACAAIGFLFLIERRRSWFDWRLMLLAATGIIAFNAVVSDRGASVRGMLGGEETDVYAAKYDLDPLEHMDFAGMEYFEYIVYAVPQRTGSYDYFAHNLQILTEPIPRVLWEGKPIGSPVQFFKLWDYGTPIGMTISLPGAGWMSLGYLGILIQAAIFALLYGWIYQRLMMRTESAFARLLFALLIATSIVVFRDGILLTFVRQLPFYIGPLAIVWAIVWFTTPRLASQPTLPHAPALQAGSSPRERRRALAAQAHRP